MLAEDQDQFLRFHPSMMSAQEFLTNIKSQMHTRDPREQPPKAIALRLMIAAGSPDWLSQSHVLNWAEVPSFIALAEERIVEVIARRLRS